jgi:hypothetical protein
MRRLAIALLGALCATQASAQAVSEAGAEVRDCLLAAARVHRLPPMVLVILLKVEGGSLGKVSHNTNGTVDIGPMQVNQIWLPRLAARWNTSVQEAFAAVRDNFCANVEAGAWILRQGLDEPGADFWDGVGYYHSHDPQYKQDYLRAVLEQALRLQDQARRSSAPQEQHVARLETGGGDGQ